MCRQKLWRSECYEVAMSRHPIGNKSHLSIAYNGRQLLITSINVKVLYMGLMIAW